jgi:hypothetical protein
MLTAHRTVGRWMASSFVDIILHDVRAAGNRNLTFCRREINALAGTVREVLWYLRTALTAKFWLLGPSPQP